jgi:hypothetical protein
LFPVVNQVKPEHIWPQFPISLQSWFCCHIDKFIEGIV